MTEKSKLNRRFFMKSAGATALLGSAIGSGVAIPFSASAKGMGHTSMSVAYDLNEDFNRIGSGDAKWDGIRKANRPHDVKFPMGVADMDFRTLPHITEALQKRLNHQNWGYEGPPADYLDNIVAWNKTRYDQGVPKGNIVNCIGVLDGVLSILRSFNPGGAKVLIHTPGYSGFFSVIHSAQFMEVENPLKLVDGRYEVDYDLMAEQIDADDIKVFLLCNPQNPTGNCWTADEMKKMGDICNSRGVLVVADEIHCDFVNKHSKYIPYASLGEEYAMNSFTLKSTSKSFNLAAHRTGYMFTDNTEYMDKVKSEGHQRGLLHTMGTIAANAAYKHGAQYMDDMRSYIDGNSHFLEKFCAENMKDVKYKVHEGTYLAWLDCSAVAKKLGGAEEGQRVGDLLKAFFIEKAGVNVNPGENYGKNGVGYMRMNLGTTHAKLHGALNAMKTAIDAL
ncbi:MAG: aminotransferase class I/II-fold pyridoxal phosphate-dependent enzyme [Emcibacteraceae bacterium]|nr:aminotransferase class I/II-fold pyridoxal phosphate-dependent enzyme [Emcibacteraceae bacterium]